MYVCILDRDGQVLVHKPALEPRSVSGGGRSLSRRPRRGRRVHLHLVLACRPLRRRRHRLRPRPRALHESDPRWQGEERQDRRAQDRHAAAQRDAAAGLRVPGGHACHARSAAPTPAPGPQARPAARPHPDDQPAVQPPGLRQADRLPEQSRRRRRSLRGPRGAQDHRRRSRPARSLRHAADRPRELPRAPGQAARSASLPAAALDPGRRQGAGAHRSSTRSTT